MNAFRFRLERILQWRVTQLKAEEARLEQIRVSLNLAGAEKEKLAGALLESRQSTNTQTHLRGADLHALGSYEKRLAIQIAAVAVKMSSISKAIAQQSLVVAGCDRNVRLLERLRARRKSEWQTEFNKELDELASDFSAGQWLRQKRDSNTVVEPVTGSAGATGVSAPR